MAYVNKRKERVAVRTVDIVAAAIRAYEINSNQILRFDTQVYQGPKGQETVSHTLVNNKSLIIEMFDDKGVLCAATDRVEEAEEMIGFITQKITLNMIKGAKVPDFTKAVNEALQNEESDQSKIGLLLYVPNIYKGMKEREKVENEISEFKYTSQPIGKVGDKISFNLTVLAAKPVQFDAGPCWAVFGKDENGNLVSFFTGHKHLTESKKISAKVKSFGKDQYHANAMVSRLNYVKASA